MSRKLWEIAADIIADLKLQAGPGNWTVKYYGAVPYLNAMRELGSVSENFGMDSGKSMVLYAMSNLGKWRGERARALKAELKGLLRGG
jgi:hypothetical protein